mgnify:CR=1 FL=1
MSKVRFGGRGDDEEATTIVARWSLQRLWYHKEDDILEIYFSLQLNLKIYTVFMAETLYTLNIYYTRAF